MFHKHLILPLLTLASLSSCTPPTTTSPAEKIPIDWIFYKPGNYFSFLAPPDLVAQHLRGIDSFVDTITSAPP